MSGVPLQVPPSSLSLYTNESLSGWGAHLLDLMTSGVWTEEESQEHINMLEMRAVEFTLAAFLTQLAWQSVVLVSDNVSFVAYLRHQGGTMSGRLCLMASVSPSGPSGIWCSWKLVTFQERRTFWPINSVSQTRFFQQSGLSYLKCLRGFEYVWPSSSRSVCHSIQHKTAALHVPNSGSSHLEAGCSSSLVGPSLRLSHPPICTAPSGDLVGSGVRGLSFVFVALL